MQTRSWPALLSRLFAGESLTDAETGWAMGEIVSGAATPGQFAAFAAGLRAKGETAEELSGLVAAMLAHAVGVDLPEPVRAAAVDVVGTGGDRAHTVNISTMAAIVAAGAGATVVKHGNRAASSQCGTADVLEVLGLNLGLGPEAVRRTVTEVGIGFCMAARFHPGMRHVAGVRRELGVPTAFNFLGPLTNPARPRAGAIGCFDARMAPLMAQVFAARGDSVLVVRGEDGLDEISTAAPTRVWVAAGGAVTALRVDAADLGLARASLADLRGGDAAHNAAVIRRLVAGADGPVRDAVLVNAAAALVAQAGLADVSENGLRRALGEAVERAAAAVDSGAAAQTLDRWLAAARTAPASPDPA